MSSGLGPTAPRMRPEDECGRESEWEDEEETEAEREWGRPAGATWPKSIGIAACIMSAALIVNGLSLAGDVGKRPALWKTEKGTGKGEGGDYQGPGLALKAVAPDKQAGKKACRMTTLLYMYV
jgi:hypothetical protein